MWRRSLPAERAHCIYDQLVPSPEWLTGCAENCLQSCAILLEAVFWIEECNGISTKVDLSRQFNVNNGIVTNGKTFTGGFGNSGRAYSFEALPSPLIYKGSEFKLGPPNALDGVANATIPLPSGHFAQLQMAALLVYKTSTPGQQTFTITYSDNSTQTYSQDMSDWTSTGATYPGETIVAAMTVWNKSDGITQDQRTRLYGYAFQLDASKAVASLTLPATSNVIVMAVNLVCTTNVDLSQAFNLNNCIVTNGTTFTGGLDGGGLSYSSILLDSPVIYKGVELKLGPANGADGVANLTVTLPSGHFAELQIAALLVFRSSTPAQQTFTVTYFGSSTQAFSQSMSDWFLSMGYPGETIVATMPY